MINTSQELVKIALNNIKNVAKKNRKANKVLTGFTELDDLTSGFKPGELTVIAGRPGMGKTAFATTLARNMAIGFEYPVAFFTLDMSSIKLIIRMISSETGISSEKLRKGNLEEHQWSLLNVKSGNLYNSSIFIDDTPYLSYYNLAEKTSRLISQHDIKIIIIDNIQLMNLRNRSLKNREKEISIIIKHLKALALEFEIPIIFLSVLSRTVETRGGSKRPLLSDLQEEIDADTVLYIYRPEYYGLTEWEDGSPCEGQAELVVAKHLSSDLKNIRLQFIGHLASFKDLN
mgnify:CR=1 FL=1